MRSAVNILFVFCSTFLFSQEQQFSRVYETLKKNVAVAIYNNDSAFFYLLRINKDAHDISIERRSKPDARILAYTPLKLDSINASWFNYERLDYLFFQHNHKAYFVFEKVLNSKKFLYMKEVDTSGKASGFIEIAEIEADKGTLKMEFGFYNTIGNRLLIIAAKTGNNGIKSKVATLYDCSSRQKLWIRKLPIENALTDLSSNFTTDADDNLYYSHVKNKFIGYETAYYSNATVTRPQLEFDSLLLFKWDSDSGQPMRVNLLTEGLRLIKNITITTVGKVVYAELQCLQTIKGSNSVIESFVNFNFDNVMKAADVTTNKFDGLLAAQLNFYDGPEKDYRLKFHDPLYKILDEHNLYTINGRQDGNYYKELLLRKTNLKNGTIEFQKIVPRKIFFFRNRERFKFVGNVMVSYWNTQLHLVVMESPFNYKKIPENFEYHKFKKESSLWNSNIVMYSITDAGELRKKLIYRNADFDLIPLAYEAQKAADMVFYLSNGRFEKFLFLNLKVF